MPVRRPPSGDDQTPADDLNRRRDHDDSHASSSHDAPTSDLVHSRSSKPAIPDPLRIGPYRIVRRIGERSGMGLVYLAVRDDDQFKKRVAVKVIKPGMDSEAILERFERERQVLAALNHSNIARFLDGGSTEDGRPYFVMEYIEGQPILKYCDNNRLKIEERLELFACLCRAVHHAHQNLVVHRDIKPSNVVVTAEGELKLLDFGIAKLLNPELSVFVGDPTATELRVMTPEYASPEQVRGDPITTASDIYSLGVLLYELLTGRRPYHIKTRVQKEIERVVCHEDPERPSTAITHPPPVDADAPTSDVVEAGTAATGTTIEEVAKVRALKPERLRRRLAGDIDNIVLMAMRKEPKRRYTSAEQFSEDIKRHLHGDPVIARAQTVAYRVGKFVQRNKALAAAAAVVTLALTIGFTVATVQWRRADVQRQRADIESQRARTESDRARIAEQQAIVERDNATRILSQLNLAREFPSEILNSIDEEIRNTPGALAMRELMVKHATKYLENLEKQNSNEPAAKFDIALAYCRLGDIQGGLRSSNRGQAEAAARSYQKSIAVWKEVIRRNPGDVRAKHELLYCQIKAADLITDKAEQANAFSAIEYEAEAQLASSPNDAEMMRMVAIALLNRCDLERQKQNLDEANRLVDRSIELRQEVRRLRPNDDRAEREVAVALVRKADIADSSGDSRKALDVYRNVLTIRQQLFDTSPHNVQRQRDLMNAHLYIASLFARSDSGVEARRHYQAAADRAQQLWNSEIQANVRSRNDMCAALAALSGIQREDNPEQALESAEQALTYIEFSAPDDKIAQERKAQALRMQVLALKELGRFGDARLSIAKAKTILANLDAQKKAVKNEIDAIAAIQKELDSMPQAANE